jgi:hypothetical protein
MVITSPLSSGQFPVYETIYATENKKTKRKNINTKKILIIGRLLEDMLFKYFNKAPCAPSTFANVHPSIHPLNFHGVEKLPCRTHHFSFLFHHTSIKSFNQIQYSLSYLATYIYIPCILQHSVLNIIFPLNYTPS